MLTLLTNAADISQAQNYLMKSIRHVAGPTVRLTVRHAHGQYTCDAFILPSSNSWVILDTEDNRFWNVGGVFSAAHAKPQNIEIEVNPPFNGRNAQIQGAFARDAKGRVFLVHRGRVGGNFTGATKQAFWSHAGWTPTKMEDAGSTTAVMVVCAVDADDIHLPLAKFILGAAAFKDHLRALRAATKHA